MDDCTLWTGARTHNGYGKRTVRGRATGRTVRAHVYAYELVHGPVADGMDVSHLCGVRLCINVNHLIAESRAANLRRIDRCRNDHEYTSENTVIRQGTRRCLTCYRQRESA